MGSRPSSYLGYGIAWEEHELNEVEDFDPHELEGDSFIETTIWACSEVPQLFVCIKESYHWNDWDNIDSIDVSKLVRKTGWDDRLEIFCKKHKLEYKKPKVLLLSYYG